jgi:hypothetical protein
MTSNVELILHALAEAAAGRAAEAYESDKVNHPTRAQYHRERASQYRALVLAIEQGRTVISERLIPTAKQRRPA